MARRDTFPTWLLAACLVAATLVSLVHARPAVGSGQVKAAGARPAQSDASPAVYPPQTIPLRFDHARHVQSIGLPCAYCHSDAITSRRASDRLLPPASRCDACHGTDHQNLDAVRAGSRPSGQCSFCHQGYSASEPARVARVVIPAANLRFDHAVHANHAIACAECHRGVAQATLATRDMLPDMRTCMRCHSGAAPEGLHGKEACDACHLTATGARLQTRFATGTLTPPSWMHGALHGADWIERHKVVAGSDSAFCATCHSEQECTDCHDGRVRPRRIHPNDWISLHPTVARQNGPSCTSCHREQSFCLTCHTRAGLTLSGPTALTAVRGRFHPPREVWSDLPRTASHHAWEAERNLSACVSCHTERDCATCHATALRGGRGGLSPHAPGFSSDCRAAFSKNPRPCLYCHDPSDGKLAPCR